jgi:trehalose/maltose transport system substrate-binding protein
MAPHLRDLSADLSQAAQGAFPEIVRNDTINGKLVALPYYVDAGMLFYRTDLLKKYHYTAPPATWQQLEQMATTIQAGERKQLPDFAGYVWQGRAYEGLTCNALEWQVSNGGGEIFSADTGAANVANPQAVAAFERAAGWVGRISPKEVLNFQEEDARKRFQAGHAAFMRNWPYAYAGADADDSPIHGKFDVAPLPRDENAEHGAATLGGWQLGVSAYSQHPEAAVAFVKYLASPEVQKWRAIEGAFLPTQRVVYDDGEVQRARPFMKSVPAVMEQAVARPSGRTKELYSQVSRVYYAGVHKILEGAPAAATCNAMQHALQALLK